MTISTFITSNLFYLATLYKETRKRRDRERERYSEEIRRIEEIVILRELRRERDRERYREEIRRIEENVILRELEIFLMFEEFKNISIKNGSVIKDSDCLSKCVICIEDCKPDDIIREINHCKHSFHVKCIDKWFVENNSCPECRYYIC
jgi:hypothetical protein